MVKIGIEDFLDQAQSRTKRNPATLTDSQVYIHIESVARDTLHFPILLISTYGEMEFDEN